MSCTRGSEIEAKMRCGLEARFALLKQGLLLERLDEIAQPETHALVIQQASEAASLAWLTGYPLLTFPCLFEEMASEATAFLGWQARRYWRGLQWEPPAAPPRREQLERCPTRYLMRLRQQLYAGRPLV
jgi:hypothetical protein